MSPYNQAFHQPPQSFHQRFLRLDTLLTSLRKFWQGMPFECPDLPWRDSHPEMCQWLDSQSLEQLQQLKNEPEKLVDALSVWIPELEELRGLSRLLPAARFDVECSSRLAEGIPGRKWEQITAFNQALPSSKSNWLEWCAGKGYLGRVLSASRQSPVTSLEWQEPLCAQGQDYANRHGLDMNFVHGDAFSQASGSLVAQCDHAVALHACGDLHVALIKNGVEAGTAAMSISPCCYHLIREDRYKPLSDQGKASALSLSKHDLRLPLQETVTAGNTVRNKRFIEVSFRLGFDSLQKELSGHNAYLPVPNVKKSILNEGFEAFCQWAAEQKNITLPENYDFGRFLIEGEKRFYHFEKMETIRTLFRRPLELWLVLDRVLFLESRGYAVLLSEFCQRELTPRNILIQAIKAEREA